jgi:sulfite exporter TauE/SafE
MNKSQKPSSVGPVVLVTLGVVLIAAAFALIAFQPSDAQTIESASTIWGQIGVAFVTGLTTGGLSCLAVQGGLLAGSLAHQVEQDLAAQRSRVHLNRRGKKVERVDAPRANSAFPILLFLLAKLAAYTLLGALLGWLGSLLSLSPVARAALMIAIGVFMIGNALRMFNVHPIFRYFSVEPPKFITRYIRRAAKSRDEARPHPDGSRARPDMVTPLFLGALTVFIPCGVTQAMMATALGTGSALMGAALMFAFTLGASPVFFLLAWLTTELGARLEKFFMRFVAAVVLILGLVTMNSGLNLIGSPLSFNNLTRGGLASSPSGFDPDQPLDADGSLTLNVQNQGYFPHTLRAAANTDFILNLVTKETYSCARDFVIPDLNYYQLLPATGTVQVNIPAQPAGARLPFTCSMGMYTGVIVFE